MKINFTLIFFVLFYIFLHLFVGFIEAKAQETTGKLQGYIYDSLRNPLSGIIIQVTENETGVKYNTISLTDGFYIFQQLNPGKKYIIEAQAIGYYKYIEADVRVQLGEINFKNIILKEQSNSLNEVVIISDKNDPLANRKKGNETVIYDKVIIRTPNLNRSIQDITRVLPEANQNSFAGSNYRFNNLSIDGLNTNDIIGFQEPASGASGSVASGTPGGLAGTQPIGFGAIEALSIKIAPFDVIYGNFTGANINAVTKSGGNLFLGNAYIFGRNDILIGNYVAGVEQQQAAFYDYQTGFSFGGKIIKNKLFYFFNAEYTDRKEPVLNEPGSNTSNIPLELVIKIADTLKSKYNYNPGIYQNATIQRANIKLFFRLDYIISDKHKLTLRDNFVKGYADNLEWTPNFFNFGNQGYRHYSTTNSLAAELKSTFSNKVYNKLTLGYTHVHDNRSFSGEVFPHIEISYNSANIIFAGTYREAAVYGTYANSFQFTDNLSYYHNKHIYTIGTIAEFNSIQYLFLSAWNGRWQYSSIDNFFNDLPSRIRGVYNVADNDYMHNKKTPSADYEVLLAGIYAQDEYRITPKFTLQYGLRVDMQYHPGKFPVSERITQTQEFTHFKNEINSTPQINPRTSFNYLITDKIIGRGGSGLFTGRIPFLWYAYVHYISGTVYNNIDYKPVNPIILTTDLSSLSNLQPGLTEINLVDNNFKLPRDWKNNLAIDFKLKKDIFFTVEATYSKVLNGLLFQSINFKDSIGYFNGADNRPYYLASGSAIKINPTFTNVFLLTNTDKGYRYNVTAGITKKGKRYNGYLGYSYGVSKDITSTVRNSHAANYEWNQSIIANKPQLSFSNFDLRHKISSYHFYEWQIKSSAKLKVGFLFYARSGNPYSYVYEGDVNRDGSAKNDLIYIPETENDIVFADIKDANGNVLVTAHEQWIQFDNYIKNDNYLKSNRGKYAERNGARTPWNFSTDARITCDIKVKKNELEINLDIFNIANLINKNWGKQHFVPNVQNSGYGILDFVNIENQKPVFQFKNPSGTPWLVDPVFSRWLAQLGIQFYF